MKRACPKFTATLAALATFVVASVVYAQGTWTPLAPVIPLPTEGMTVGGVGQVIIAAYGLSATDTNLTRLYNINTNSWTLGAPAPLPGREEAAYGEAVHAGFLYAIGGKSLVPVAAVYNNLERYDPVTNMWATLTPMPTARAGSAAAVVDNAVYVIGGRTQPGGPCTAGETAVVERYDVDTDTWRTVAPLPSARSDLAAMAHGGKIFVFGGCLSGVVTNEVDMYNPETDTWTTGLTPMPTARASLVAGKSGDNVYAIGGLGTTGTALSVNEVYKISSNSWSTAAPMPTARGEAGVHSHGGRIYVVGGFGVTPGVPTNANEVFKPKPE